MNIDDLRETEFTKFVKDLFTLRTVWIDKGQGRWAVKKRLHPLLRGIFCTAGVVLCAIIYSAFQNPQVVDAQPQSVIVTAKLPEPEPLLVTANKPEAVKVKVQEMKQESTPSIQEEQHIIIPLTTKKANASTIKLPSEKNPGTDRIIAPVNKPAEKKPPVNKPAVIYAFTFQGQ